jgi:Ulp1 family protease
MCGLSSAVHLTTQDLALFLSSQWLNDEMINAGTDYILRRLKPGSRVRILNCLFIQALGNHRAQRETYTPPTFSSIERAIRAGIVDVVWFPLHVGGNHWTLLKIDLVSRTIVYADSLYGLPPIDELALVQWWLKSLLSISEDFSVIEPDFVCPRQQDGHSCGIIILSILASVLLQYEPWIPAHAQAHRMEWFLRFCETFADGVCLSSRCAIL